MRQILLDRNENRYGPAPACLQALKNAAPELLFNYSRDFQSGHYSRLSHRLSELHRVDEKRLILGYGCEDILKEAVHHFLPAGGRIFVPSASWWYYRAVAEEVGGKTLEYPLVEGPETYSYDLDALMAMQDRSPAHLLLIASPNNPTGNSLPHGRLRGILDRFRDVPVILDQAYHGFGTGPEEDLASLTRDYPRLLVLRTFSKLYGLAGVRIGYGMAGEGLSTLIKFCSRNLGYNRLSEELALAALDSRSYYDSVRVRMAEDRARIIKTLTAFKGVRAYQSDANFVLVRFPSHRVKELKDGLSAKGLIIKFFDEPAFRDCARVTLGTPEETGLLLDALNALLASEKVLVR